jgi:hypothetical protein
MTMLELSAARRQFLTGSLGCAASAAFFTNNAFANAQTTKQPGFASPAYASLPMMALVQTTARTVIAVGARGNIMFADTTQNVIALPPKIPGTVESRAAQDIQKFGVPIAWRRASAGVDTTLTSVRFASATRGYITGHEGKILRTDDAGATWQLVSAKATPGNGNNMPLFDVATASADDVIVIGAFGNAFRSRDGGRNWVALSLPNPKGLHLYSVVHSEGVWSIAGEQGLLLQSLDNGSTWDTIPVPTMATWFGVMPGRMGAATVYGLQGTVLHRSAGAKVFSKVATPNKSTITAATRTQNGDVVFAAQSGQLLRWSERNTETQTIPFSSPFPVTAMASVVGENIEYLWVAGVRGAVKLPIK